MNLNQLSSAQAGDLLGLVAEEIFDSVEFRRDGLTPYVRQDDASAIAARVINLVGEFMGRDEIRNANIEPRTVYLISKPTDSSHGRVFLTDEGGWTDGSLGDYAYAKRFATLSEAVAVVRARQESGLTVETWREYGRPPRVPITCIGVVPQSEYAPKPVESLVYVVVTKRADGERAQARRFAVFSASLENGQSWTGVVTDARTHDTFARAALWVDDNRAFDQPFWDHCAVEEWKARDGRPAEFVRVVPDEQYWDDYVKHEDGRMVRVVRRDRDGRYLRSDGMWWDSLDMAAVFLNVRDAIRAVSGCDPKDEWSILTCIQRIRKGSSMGVLICHSTVPKESYEAEPVEKQVPAQPEEDKKAGEWVLVLARTGVSADNPKAYAGVVSPGLGNTLVRREEAIRFDKPSDALNWKRRWLPGLEMECRRTDEPHDDYGVMKPDDRKFVIRVLDEGQPDGLSFARYVEHKSLRTGRPELTEAAGEAAVFDERVHAYRWAVDYLKGRHFLIARDEWQCPSSVPGG